MAMRQPEDRSPWPSAAEVERRDALMREQFARDSEEWENALSADEALAVLRDRLERDD